MTQRRCEGAIVEKYTACSVSYKILARTFICEHLLAASHSFSYSERLLSYQAVDKTS